MTSVFGGSCVVALGMAGIVRLPGISLKILCVGERYTLHKYRRAVGLEHLVLRKA